MPAIVKSSPKIVVWLSPAYLVERLAVYVLPARLVQPHAAGAHLDQEEVAAVRVLDVVELPHEEAADFAERPDQGDDEAVVEERAEVLADGFVALADGAFEPHAGVREVPLADEGGDEGALDRDEEGDVEVHEEEEQEGAVVGVPGHVGLAHFGHVEFGPGLDVYVVARSHEEREADHSCSDDRDLDEAEHERHHEHEDAADRLAQDRHAREVEEDLGEPEQHLQQRVQRDQAAAPHHAHQEYLAVRRAALEHAIRALLLLHLRQRSLRCRGPGKTCTPRPRSRRPTRAP